LYSDSYLDLEVGLYSSVFVDDIDGNGFLNMFVGQDLGGLFLFEADPLSSASVPEMKIELNLVLFPNPGNELIHVLSKDGNLTGLKLHGAYNILGQNQDLRLLGTGIDVSGLKAGTYYFVLETDGRIEHLNFIKN
jgi:hypothetical protein